MSIETRAGMYCERCQQPVVAECATPPENVLDTLCRLVGEPMPNYEPWHCRHCGGPVRNASVEDYGDWRTVPEHLVPVWRRRDRERLNGTGSH